MGYEFTINVNASGDYTEEDLKQFIFFNRGVSGINPDNPFIDEDSDANIDDVDFD